MWNERSESPIEHWKKGRVFRVPRGLYYPVMWAIIVNVFVLSRLVFCWVLVPEASSESPLCDGGRCYFWGLEQPTNMAVEIPKVLQMYLSWKMPRNDSSFNTIYAAMRKNRVMWPKVPIKYYIPINRFSQDLHQAVGKNGWIPSKVGHFWLKPDKVGPYQL